MHVFAHVYLMSAVNLTQANPQPHQKKAKKVLTLMPTWTSRTTRISLRDLLTPTTCRLTTWTTTTRKSVEGQVSKAIHDMRTVSCGGLIWNALRLPIAMGAFSNLGGLKVHQDINDDPYITLKEDVNSRDLHPPLFIYALLTIILRSTSAA
jgi:hypothetical protein